MTWEAEYSVVHSVNLPSKFRGHGVDHIWARTSLASVDGLGNDMSCSGRQCMDGISMHAVAILHDMYGPDVVFYEVTSQCPSLCCGSWGNFW